MIRTIKEFEDTMFPLIVSMLGWEEDTDKVRIGWQQDSTPEFGIDENYIFVSALPVEDDISKHNDVSTEETSPGLNLIKSFTRVMEMNLVAYGPEATKNLTTIRFGYYRDIISHQLAKEEIFLVTDIPSVKRLPELFQGRWWERADLRIRFNELVTVTEAINNIESVEVEVWNEDGLQKTIEIN